MTNRLGISRGAVLLTFLLMISAGCSENSGETGSTEGPPANGSGEGVPALIDLGSTTCVPCQMMEGELERIDEITGDRLAVSFIDVNENPDAASDYGIRVIPTQVFLAPDGTELFRHEGYMSAEQMLSKWIALGYDLNESAEVR